MNDLKSLVREVPDFPKPGILFYDITTLLKDRDGYHKTIERLCSFYRGRPIDVVVGIEARGFIFAPVLAYVLGAGFVPVRKPKKLPCAVEYSEYQLEYGTDRLEVHKDAIAPGQNALIVDDVLATGGTADAAARLVGKMGAKVTGFGFVIELDFLDGRKRIANFEVHSLLHY